MGDDHFANVPVEFRVKLSDVYCLFCLTGYLRFFFFFFFFFFLK